MSSDPASLAKLHDIVLPAAPGWWPPAPAWYGLALVLVAVVLWQLYRYWRRYRCNRYRRAALFELQNIERACDPEAVLALPGLLKRTAILAYSRDQVAALSQDNWLRFLNQHCAAKPFSGHSGKILLTLTYKPADFDQSDRQELIISARTWIRQHRTMPC